MAGRDLISCNHVFIETEYYECEYCNKHFTTAYNLNRHKKGNCLENVCEKCNLRFQKVDQLRNHILTCSGKQPHQCEFCAKSFMKNSNLNRHRQTHTEKCQKCRSVFYKRMPLITVYPNEPILTCSHCLDTFKSQEALDKHMEGHLHSFTNKCEACALTFDKKRQLLKHKQKFHPSLIPPPKNRKTYECPLCARCFRLYRDLKAHIQKHTERGEKVFRCKTCGAGYTRKIALKMHMLKHGNKEKPRCEICSKSFSHPYCLRAHMRIHTNYRPFKCSTCNQSFRQQGHLIRHRLTHGQSNTHSHKKPRSCEICSKTFKDLTGLRIHKLTHTGVQRYACSYCPKTFLSKKTQADHINMHTGEKPYKCQMCPEAFSQSGQLYKHKRSHTELKSPNSLQPVQAQALHMESVQPQSAEHMMSVANHGSDQGTITLLDSLFLPVQMNVQGQSVALHNQLQPIHNPPEEMTGVPRPDGYDQLALQHVHLQFPNPVNMVKERPETVVQASDMPTYWHLQQSNLVQYHHQNQDMKTAVVLQPNSVNLQGGMAPSTIEVISNSMQQLQQNPNTVPLYMQTNQMQ